MTAKEKPRTAKVLAVSVAVLLFRRICRQGICLSYIAFRLFRPDCKQGLRYFGTGNKYTGDFTYIKAGDTDILVTEAQGQQYSDLYEYVSTRATDGIIE